MRNLESMGLARRLSYLSELRGAVRAAKTVEFHLNSAGILDLICVKRIA
jgi:hypothetical protein